MRRGGDGICNQAREVGWCDESGGPSAAPAKEQGGDPGKPGAQWQLAEPNKPRQARVLQGFRTTLSLCSASDKTCRLPPHLRLHCRVPSRCTFFPAGVPEITSNFSALRSGARVGGTGRSSGGSDSGSMVSATLAAGPLSGNSIFELPARKESLASGTRLRGFDCGALMHDSSG